MDYCGPFPSEEYLFVVVREISKYPEDHRHFMLELSHKTTPDIRQGDQVLLLQKHQNKLTTKYDSKALYCCKKKKELASNLREERYNCLRTERPLWDRPISVVSLVKFTHATAAFCHPSMLLQERGRG